MNKGLRVISGNVVNFSNRIYTHEEKNIFQTSLLSDWELQQKAKGYTMETINLNLRNINEFLRLTDKYIWDITHADVDKFYYYLVNKNLSHSTRRKYQSNINTFISYLKTRKAKIIYENLGVTLEDVFDDFNRYYHRKDDIDIRVVPPNKEILEILFNHMKKEMIEGRRYYSVARDYVFFKLLQLLGLRINELVMINIEDVRMDLGSTGHGKIHVKYGKGSKGYGPKPRWIPLINDSHKLLNWYIENIYPFFKKDTNCNALFILENGTRVKRDTMRGSLNRRQKKAGIPKEYIFGAHQLRHAFATEMTKEGLDILTLSKILGHSQVSTTSGYIDPNSDYIEDRIRLSKKKWLKDLSEMEE